MLSLVDKYKIEYLVVKDNSQGRNTYQTSNCDPKFEVGYTLPGRYASYLWTVHRWTCAGSGWLFNSDSTGGRWSIEKRFGQSSNLKGGQGSRNLNEVLHSFGVHRIHCLGRLVSKSCVYHINVMFIAFRGNWWCRPFSSYTYPGVLSSRGDCGLFRRNWQVCRRNTGLLRRSKYVDFCRFSEAQGDEKQSGGINQKQRNKISFQLDRPGIKWMADFLKSLNKTTTKNVPQYLVTQ